MPKRFSRLGGDVATERIGRRAHFVVGEAGQTQDQVALRRRSVGEQAFGIVRLALGDGQQGLRTAKGGGQLALVALAFHELLGSGHIGRLSAVRREGGENQLGCSEAQIRALVLELGGGLA